MTAQDIFATDPELAVLFDQAAYWLLCVHFAAAALDIETPEGIDAIRSRTWTGYMPKPQRRNVYHRTLRDGLRTKAPINPSDSVRQAAARDGFVGGRYVGASR